MSCTVDIVALALQIPSTKFAEGLLRQNGPYTRFLSGLLRIDPEANPAKALDLYAQKITGYSADKLNNHKKRAHSIYEIYKFCPAMVLMIPPGVFSK